MKSRAHPCAATGAHKARCWQVSQQHLSDSPVAGAGQRQASPARESSCPRQPICALRSRRLLRPSPIYLHAESEDRDDNFEHQSQGELPHGGVDSWAGRSVGNVIHWPGHVWVIDVVAELRGLQGTAVIEELGDQLAGAPAGVGVGVGDDGSDSCYHDDLQHWIFPKPGGFSPPAPGNVASDEEGPPEAPKDAEQDEGEELSHVPGGVVLHVEQDQSAVSKRIDGPQCEGSHESSKKRPPEGFQRKVVADLKPSKDHKHFTERDRGCFL